MMDFGECLATSAAHSKPIPPTDPPVIRTGMSKTRRFARLTRFAPYVVGEGLRDLCTCACS